MLRKSVVVRHMGGTWDTDTECPWTLAKVLGRAHHNIHDSSQGLRVAV